MNFEQVVLITHWVQWRNGFGEWVCVCVCERERERDRVHGCTACRRMLLCWTWGAWVLLLGQPLSHHVIPQPLWPHGLLRFYVVSGLRIRALTFKNLNLACIQAVRTGPLTSHLTPLWLSFFICEKRVTVLMSKLLTGIKEDNNAKHLNSIECHTFRITTIDIQKVKEINWNWNLESVWGKVLDIWCQFMGKGK